MKQKPTVIVAMILLLGFVFLMNQRAVGIERLRPERIPNDRISVPLLSGQEIIPTFCTVQNDSGGSKWYAAGFDSGMAVAVYMDPAKCISEGIYPFKITDVHFSLYDNPIGWSWPVNIQINIKEMVQLNKCLSPDTLISLVSQSLTIPIDSSDYNLQGRPMNVSLNSPCCVHQPFFLEIKYLDHLELGDTLPSPLFDTLVTSEDSCNNWFLWSDGIYYEWSDFWDAPPPGDVILRATGYTQASDCDTGWYWKHDRQNAPSGMPDFNQNQDEWVAYCGPAAAANCLWWYGAVPVGWSPPQLIDTLARYFRTNPSWGTFVDTMQMGLDQYFEDYGLPYQTYLYPMPYFHEMEESLKVSQDVILLLGEWEQVEGDSFVRQGGHYVTMAGVNSESLQVAFSDPDRNHAEDGYPGRVRPPHAPHPSDPLKHNDPTYVSQDIYTSTETSPSPGNPHWGLTDYLTVTGLSPAFEGKNFHPSQLKYYSPSEEGKGPQFIEVDYTLMICPKVSAVEEEETPNVPHEFELYQNYPNPFNPITTIRYSVKGKAADGGRRTTDGSSFPTTLKIYNILGQKVRTLVDEAKPEGYYEVVWDGKDEKGNSLASGIYFYRLQIGDQSQTRRMLLLK
jgi:hypothetical protein